MINHVKELNCRTKALFKVSLKRFYIIYLSTIIPARIAWATLLNFGLSIGFWFILVKDRVKVIESQFLTSDGTESGSTSDKTSSSSTRRLIRGKSYKIYTLNY